MTTPRFGDPLGLLKIDVEGMELQVLRGASGLISEHRPAVAAEVNRRHLARVGTALADLDAFFGEHGYHLFINITAHHREEERFTIGRLPALRLLRVGGDSLRLVDVLAVHPSSDRYPGAAASATRTYGALASAGMRAIKRRGARFVRRG